MITAGYGNVSKEAHEIMYCMWGETINGADTRAWFEVFRRIDSDGIIAFSASVMYGLIKWNFACESPTSYLYIGPKYIENARDIVPNAYLCFHDRRPDGFWPVIQKNPRFITMKIDLYFINTMAAAGTREIR